MAEKHRKLDVYVGVDVFGRGCFGGGGLDMFKVQNLKLKKIFFGTSSIEGVKIKIFWNFKHQRQKL
jgi:hypothetical protein